MKKIIVEILKKHFTRIVENWAAEILKRFMGKMSEQQVRTFAHNTLHTLMAVIDTSDYTLADQYLIDTYKLFLQSKLNLLEISQVFTTGSHSILYFVEEDDSHNYDPVILLSFIEQVMEQIYARYSVLHQEMEMKDLEDDRDRLAAKLEASEEYLKSILHSSDSAILAVDENEKFVAWNRGAEKIFGYTEEEILNQSSSFLLPNGDKYKAELETIKEEVQKHGYVKINETERKTKDGSIVTVQLNISQLPSNNGSYKGRSVVIKDFTEVKRLQQQVDQSEKLAVIGQVAAGVAHEIGNPLASISSIVQILQRKSKDEFVNSQLATVKQNIDRITRIVREMVDFSRPPSHEKEIVQVTDVVKTALGIVKYDKRVKKVNFDTDLTPHLPKVMIVPDQLLQVFVNIMLNALDAIEGNGTITVKTLFDSQNIYIKISDNGTGMDEQTMNKIFDPFYTTKEVGKGTGLGLSVSYGIIQKFGGKISVESKLNVSSTFTVTLPISK